MIFLVSEIVISLYERSRTLPEVDAQRSQIEYISPFEERNSNRQIYSFTVSVCV